MAGEPRRFVHGHGARRHQPGALTIECHKCRGVFPTSEFTKNAKTLNGFGRTCRHCRQAYYAGRRDEIKANAKQWYRDNPDQYRDSKLRGKYGITLDDYKRLLASQGGVCALCGRAETFRHAKNLAVDHCHETGRIRGLLCASCNKGIGLLGDDPFRLVAAARYLYETSTAKSPNRHLLDLLGDVYG